VYYNITNKLQLRVICYYLHDKKNGEYMEYCLDGNLIKHLIYAHGKIVQTIK
jgi:antitoxin component YwqK of YwqJK toxin-antitoxin module